MPNDPHFELCQNMLLTIYQATALASEVFCNTKCRKAGTMCVLWTNYSRTNSVVLYVVCFKRYCITPSIYQYLEMYYALVEFGVQFKMCPLKIIFCYLGKLFSEIQCLSYF